MRVRRTTFVLAALVGRIAVSVQASDRPPKDLHLVDGHWTAWNPPSPDGGASRSTSWPRGDTLWDIAAKYYGNAYLWPQVWEKNKYVLDAHWIYPGDPLVLGLNVAPVENLTENGAAGAAADRRAPAAADHRAACGRGGRRRGDRLAGAARRRDRHLLPGLRRRARRGVPLRGRRLGVRGAVDRPVRPREHRLEGRQLRQQREPTVKIGLTSGDIIYVDGGQRPRADRPARCSPSSRPTSRWLHPLTKRGGRPLLPLPRPAPHPLRPGDHRHRRDRADLRSHRRRRPARCRSSPSRCRSAAAPPCGRSTTPPPPRSSRTLRRSSTSRDDILALGADHVVHIDVGEQDTTPGDIYTIYRENRPGLPPVVVGELAVLSVHKRFSVAKIIESRYPIRLGDRLDPK